MSDMFDGESGAEPTVSIGDNFTTEEEELEADMIPGGDKGKECTYSKGYVKRQAIFSCLTCTPDRNAGVCTACSLVCHDGHEIQKLWTKRNFKCDCGNSKFGEFSCKLLASKDEENPENMYNHNFKGAYCTCDLPYPDPNVEEQIEMIQCCICEDWFHEEHMCLHSGDKIPRDEEGELLYEDLICQGCAVVCSFLTCYPQIISASDPSDTAKEEAAEGNAEAVVKECSEVGGPSNKCIIGGIIDHLPTTENSKPLFVSKGWRECLCRCGKCWDFYAQRRIGFLLDKEDSIAEYERMVEQKRNENIHNIDDPSSSFQRPKSVKRSKLKRKQRENVSIIANLVKEQNEILMELLLSLTEKGDLLRTKRIEAKNRSFQIKEMRKEDKIILINLDTISDPEQREFLRLKQEEIMQKRRPAR